MRNWHERSGQWGEKGEREDLSERMLRFCIAAVKLVDRYAKTPAGRHVSGQFLRASSSSGANYEEACGAESRNDFVHKLQVVLKELKESRFWLRLTLGAALAPEPETRPLLDECEQLCKIIAKSVVTAKSRR